MKLKKTGMLIVRIGALLLITLLGLTVVLPGWWSAKYQQVVWDSVSEHWMSQEDLK